MTLAILPALLVGLLCAAFFILLFQYLFPRPAPWRLVACALGAGIVVTYLFTLLLEHLATPTMAAIQQLKTLSDALRFATLRAALPEEAAKGIATLVALLPFWRRATPAQSFQAALIVAVGFAVVENRGYAAAFHGYALLIAIGRGLLATFIHASVAMIFGAFLMRFVAGGWRGWHLPILGYLAASLAHALHDAGLMLPMAEFVTTESVAPDTVLRAIPMVLFGFGLLLVWGLWSLRHATRRAAAGDPVTEDPQHQVVVRNWRRAANVMLVIGALGLAGAIAWLVVAETTGDQADVLRQGLTGAVGVAIGLFLVLLSWVLRQKR